MMDLHTRFVLCVQAHAIVRDIRDGHAQAASLVALACKQEPRDVELRFINKLGDMAAAAIEFVDEHAASL